MSAIIQGASNFFSLPLPGESGVRNATLQKAAKIGLALGAGVTIFAYFVPVKLLLAAGSVIVLSGLALYQLKNINVLGKDGLAPLHGMAQRGNAYAVKLLLWAGAEPNVKNGKGNIPLDPAIDHLHLNIIKMLAQYGISPAERLNMLDHEKLSHLHRAAWHGDLLRVKALLQLGADPNFKDGNGNMPLHSAAALGHLPIVQELIDGKADVHAQGNSNLTPLDGAVEFFHDNVVELLVNQGADPRSKPLPSASTPFDAARFIRSQFAKGAQPNRWGLDTRSFEELKAAANKIVAIFEKKLALKTPVASGEPV